MAVLRAFTSHLTSALHEYVGSSPWEASILLGDDRSRIERVLLATDLNADVTAEALRARADLIVTLHAPETLPLAGEEGAYVRDLVTGGVSVSSISPYASGLVEAALANVLDLGSTVPLIPRALEEYALAVVYVPNEHAEEVRIALADAGAGAIGDYTGCAWSVAGTGEFTPGTGADPAVGTVGEHERVGERRLEMVVPLDLIPTVTTALRRAHPYEEPAFSFVMTHGAPSRTGRGRRGALAEPATLGGVRHHLARHLPGEVIRAAGEEGSVREIAIISRASEDGVEAAISTGAHLLVTSDLTSVDLSQAGEAGIRLIDVPHPALLELALAVVAHRIAAGIDGEIETFVSAPAMPTWRVE